MNPPNGFTMIGGDGRLKLGSRTVATFTRWSAKDAPGVRCMTVNVSEHTPHPTWWEFRDDKELEIHLAVGPGTWKGRAVILSEDPLAIRLEEMTCQA